MSQFATPNKCFTNGRQHYIFVLRKEAKKNFGNKDSREVVNVKYPGKFAT